MSPACLGLTDDGVECGSEGQLCESCLDRQMLEFAYLRHVPRHLVIEDEQSRMELEDELRDAGRLQ